MGIPTIEGGGGGGLAEGSHHEREPEAAGAPAEAAGAPAEAAVSTHARA